MDKIKKLKKLIEHLRDQKLYKNDYKRALLVVREIDYLLAGMVNPPLELKNEFLYRKGRLYLMFPQLEEEGEKTLKTIKEGEPYYLDALMGLTEYYLQKGDWKNFEKYLRKFEEAYKKQFRRELEKEGDTRRVHEFSMRFFQDKLERLKEKFLRGAFLVIEKNGKITRVGRSEVENYKKGDFVFVNPEKPIAVINGKENSNTPTAALRRAALLLSLEPFNLVDAEKIRKIYESKDPALLHRDLERIEEHWGVQIDRKTRRVKKLKATLIVPCVIQLKELEKPVNLCGE